MNIKKLSLISAAIFTATFGVAQAQTTTLLVDDVLDGTTTTQADLQGQYFTSSSEDAIEFNAAAGGTSGLVGTPSSGPLDSIGLPSGGSGRTMHVLLPNNEQVTLEAEGDSITTSLTFVTPTTINNDLQSNETFRLSIVDHLGRVGDAAAGEEPQLADNTSFGSSATSQNPLYNGLLGYVAEIDILNASSTAASQAASDLRFRELDPLQVNGQFTASTSCCNDLGSHPAAGYLIEPNTTYTLTTTFTRQAADSIEVSQTFITPTATFTNSAADDTPETFNFGLFALGASSDAFGLDDARDPLEADNGIDITSFSVSFFDADGVDDVEPEPPVTSEQFCFPVTATNGNTSIICFDD